MGRPSKLTDAVTKTITDAIAIGATYQAAAEYAGVGYSTFLAWMARKKKPYVAFQEAVMAANAKARVSLLSRIQKSAQGSDKHPGDWRAAAWILERRFSDEYGPSMKFSRMSDDELRAYIATHLAELGSGNGGSEAAGPADRPADENG
jgi:hypothetical protein